MRARRLFYVSILTACTSIAACGLAACGHAPTELAARGTAHAPAAKAEIDVEREGSHHDVDLQISDLVAPASLGTGHTHYGVWLRRPGTEPAFVGFLRYQEDIEYGDLELQAPIDATEIVVTAEGDIEPSTPSHTVVLRRSLH